MTHALSPSPGPPAGSILAHLCPSTTSSVPTGSSQMGSRGPASPRGPGGRDGPKVTPPPEAETQPSGLLGSPSPPHCATWNVSSRSHWPPDRTLAPPLAWLSRGQRNIFITRGFEVAQTALSPALAQSVDVGIWERGGARVQDRGKTRPRLQGKSSGGLPGGSVPSARLGRHPQGCGLTSEEAVDPLPSGI